MDSYGRTIHAYGGDCSGGGGIAGLLILRRSVFRPTFATYFRCLIPPCGNMQGRGVQYVDGHGMLCNVMHHENRWQCLLGFPRDSIY